MHVSPAGRAFIGVQEGLRLRAYRDSGGVWTIDCGHKSAAELAWQAPLSSLLRTKAINPG
jgi:GH24 family phage-related lysozyme (muramidase)